MHFKGRSEGRVKSVCDQPPGQTLDMPGVDHTHRCNMCLLHLLFMFFQLQEMEKSPANHFLILFRDSSCQFRGVYTMNPDTQELARLAGVGPRTVSSIQVESIYKYSSDRKQFSAIPSKTMGMSVDAFTIPSHLWQGGGAGGGGSRRASVTKKAVTSK